jgi:hypothetical protein
MDLRAPLPPEHAPGDGSSRPAKYDEIAKHLLCRMFMSSRMMELGSESTFTGLILFHRYVRHFYHLIEEQHRSEQKLQHQNTAQELVQIRQHLGKVAASCLFLGCKMAEEPRRIRDVINLSSVLGFSECNQSEDMNNKKTPIVIKEAAEPPALDEKYWKAKEQIVSTEQLVLRMLKFDTVVCHPHRCVLIVMDTLGFGTGKDKSSSIDADTNKVKTFLTPDQSERVIYDAWRLLNEASLDIASEVLSCSVIVLACAAIQVAADGLKIHAATDGGEKTDGKENSRIHLPEYWWQALDIKTSEIQAAILSFRNMTS